MKMAQHVRDDFLSVCHFLLKGCQEEKNHVATLSLLDPLLQGQQDVERGQGGQ